MTRLCHTDGWGGGAVGVHMQISPRDGDITTLAVVLHWIEGRTPLGTRPLVGDWLVGGRTRWREGAVHAGGRCRR